jgi:hypothetical protein
VAAEQDLFPFLTGSFFDHGVGFGKSKCSGGKSESKGTAL